MDKTVSSDLFTHRYEIRNCCGTSRTPPAPSRIDLDPIDRGGRNDVEHSFISILSWKTALGPRWPRVITSWAQARARALAAADLAARAFANIFAVIVRLMEAGTSAFMMRVILPGTTLDRFSSSALRPSDTRCSTLIGFIGMVRGSNPSLASTGRSMKHI